MQTPTSVRIRISWPAGHLDASLDGTPTSQALVKALPLVSTARTWGEEVYFGPCNVLGRLDGDPGLLATVRDGDPVRVELLDA
ncbi:cyclophilin-like family protein [Streptomyces massasporeus]|uniref:cyclophilin-like family protein n=1 Tax=Streptomyces massasporeus TaxID=67324 RepID=UPI0036E725AE